MQEAQDLKLHPTKLKPDTQVSYLENYETEGANVLCFHPFESIVIIAGKTNAVSVWDWHKEQKLHVFSNLNFLPSRISSLQLINAHYKGLLMVASTDGIIRVSVFCSIYLFFHSRRYGMDMKAQARFA